MKTETKKSANRVYVGEDGRQVIDANGIVLCMCFETWTANRIATALNGQEGLVSAIEGLMGMIEAGILVRDCSKDADPKWYLTAMQLTAALSAARSAIAAARGKG